MEEFDSWYEEKQSAYLYSILAKYEKNAKQGDLYTKLAAAAEDQANIWEDKAFKDNKVKMPIFKPNLRARIVGFLIKLIPPRKLVSILAAMKVRGVSNYSYAIKAHPVIKNLDDLEKHHGFLKKGINLRAAVFGMNDGLISNTSLILGIAGANSDPNIILLAGIAGLLAGAFSMASGEYVSVLSQKEMYEYQIGLEAEELKLYPKEEAEELRMIYEARGIDNLTAKTMAYKAVQDPASALQTLAREELGLIPADIGSPSGAAISSFIAFAIGAFIPLVPFMLNAASRLATTTILAGVSLFIIGAIISLFTGQSAIKGAARMLAIGGCSGLITFYIGKLIGVSF